MCQRLARLKSGFTLIEIIITISIIGVLSVIGTMTYNQSQARLRDSQRSTKVSAITSSLEKYYEQNGIYPDCSLMTKSLIDISNNTLKDLNTDALRSPTAELGTNSIECTITNNDSFFYLREPTEFTISYHEETNGGALKNIKSKHSMGTLAGTILTATVVDSGQINTSWNTVAGASEYEIQRATDSAFSENFLTRTQTAITLNDTGLSAGTTYYYRVKGRSTYARSSWSSTVITSTTIPTPSAPTVTATSDSTTTTWSWPAVSCASGTSVRYQYRYTTDFGSDSGWVANASSSVTFTTSNNGYTFTVQVQAQCYTASISSSWSASGSASYLRPITNHVLTLTAGPNGSVNGSGTYSSASSPTMTATPNTNYVFSSWTGSTGCSGVASHTIAMNEDKNCAATFIIAPPSIPTVTVAIAGSVATGTSSTVTCGLGTPEYQMRYHSTNIVADGTWSSWTAWSTSVKTMTASTTQGYKYTFQSQARCNYSSVYSDPLLSAPANAVMAITTTPTAAPVWTGPLIVESNQWFYNTFSATCPAGFDVYGEYDTIVQKTEFPHHPWGYYDYWTNNSKTKTEPIQVRGYYFCRTAYASSPQSPLGYGDVTMNPSP